MTLKQLIWIPLLAAVAVGLAGCSRGGEKLATINGETITLEQFHKYLETKGSVRVRTANGQVGAAEVAESLGFQALQDMIQQKLVLQMAKDEGVYPTDKDLEAEVEFQKKRNPNFLKVLTSQGLSIDDIRARLRVDLAREKLITRGLNVKTEEAEKYIADNPKEFVDPATADSLVIFVSKEAKRKEVDAELARGMEFKIVATRYSEIPGAKNNPAYRDRVLAAMPTEIRLAIEKTPDGRTTDWVKLSDGFAKFYVEMKTGEKKRPIDAILKEEVRRRLALQKGLRAREIDKNLLEKYRAAKIDVAYPSFKESFKDFWQRLKESDTLEAATAKPE